MRSYHAKIRSKLLDYKPERARLVPETFVHDVSEYGNAPELGGVYWEEMWIPLSQEPQAAKL
eukprot:SAG31_NODE_1896_length_6964_cov_3.399854_5_plen_62_part_00